MSSCMTQTGQAADTASLSSAGKLTLGGHFQQLAHSLGGGRQV